MRIDSAVAVAVAVVVVVVVVVVVAVVIAMNLQTNPCPKGKQRDHGFLVQTWAIFHL